jgi:hypothetical protein
VHRPQSDRLVTTRQLVTQYAQLWPHTGSASGGGFDNHLVARQKVVADGCSALLMEHAAYKLLGNEADTPGY